MRYLIFFIAFIIFFTGCGQDELAVKQAKNELLKQLDAPQPFMEEETKNVLYFAATKGKKYYQNIQPQYKKGWVSVEVVSNDGRKHRFLVMRSPVSVKMYKESGSDAPITNVSFETMNEFCIKAMHGMLINPFVFDAARKAKKIEKPTNGIFYELIAPADDEDDEEYISQEDNIVGKEGTMIEFDWQNERYEEVPNIYKSQEATFRCMKTE